MLILINIGKLTLANILRIVSSVDDSQDIRAYGPGGENMKFIKHALAAIAALAIITPAWPAPRRSIQRRLRSWNGRPPTTASSRSCNRPSPSGPEVTKACLACHNTAGHQVMKSIHWTWEANSPTTGKKLGAKNGLPTTFCG